MAQGHQPYLELLLRCLNYRGFQTSVPLAILLPPLQAWIHLPLLLGISEHQNSIDICRIDLSQQNSKLLIYTRQITFDLYVANLIQTCQTTLILTSYSHVQYANKQVHPTETIFQNTTKPFRQQGTPPGVNAVQYCSEFDNF